MKTENPKTGLMDLLKNPTTFLGLIFLAVNLTTSYMLYQVNSYKILLVLVGVSLLSLVALWPGRWMVREQPPLRVWVLLSLPLLMTFPGFLIQGGTNNYNFDYELVSNLILILWAGFLYQTVKHESSVTIFLSIIGGCIIIVSIWALSSKLGFNPVDKSNSIKASFGNKNYFAGFMILLFPIFFSLILPDSLSRGSISGKRWYERLNYLYLAAVLFSGVTIFAIQSRAGIGATIISSLVVILISVFYFIQSREKKKLFLIGIVLAIVTFVGTFYTLYIFDFIGGKWEAAFSVEGWFGRTVSWAAAYESIKAAPWFGFGLGSSYNLFFSYVPADARLFWGEHSYNHVHSEYLEYLQEAGLLGGLVFLFFWGYLFFQLYRIIMRSDSVLISRIAIGITGGLIAYLIQSVVSVAPRMMVVKLPLFTLFALIFVLRNISFRTERSRFTLQPLSRITANCIPVFVILGISWALYVPWMYGQYNFVKIQSSRPSIVKLQRLENLVKERGDVYALNYLTHQQIGYGRWDSLRRTIEQIDRILPYYRDLGYSKILLAKADGDLTKAISAGRDFQTRDRYFVPSIHLLLEMAIRQNDPDLFFEQITLLTRALIFKSGLQKNNKEDSVKIKKGLTNVLLAFKEETAELEIIWNLKGLQNLMNIARMNYQNGKWATKDQSIFFNSLVQLVGASPYLQLRIEPEFEKQRQNIFKQVREYFRIKREQAQKIRELDVKQKKELIRSSGTERSRIQKQQQETRETIQKSYEKKITSIDTYLAEKTAWDEYLKGSQFSRQMIQHLVQVVFPPALKQKS